jgi:hypothetical protein
MRSLLTITNSSESGIVMTEFPVSVVPLAAKAFSTRELHKAACFWSLFSSWAALVGWRLRRLGLGASISRPVSLKIVIWSVTATTSDVQYQNPRDFHCHWNLCNTQSWKWRDILRCRVKGRSFISSLSLQIQPCNSDIKQLTDPRRLGMASCCGWQGINEADLI